MKAKIFFGSMLIVSLLAVFAIVMPFANALMQQPQIWSTIAVGTSLPSNVPRTGYMFFRTSDSTVHITNKTWNSVAMSKKPDMLDLPGTFLSGAADSTMNDVPSKQFATGDSAFFDIGVSKRFTSLDSVVIYTVTPSAAGDSMALSLRVKKVGWGGSTSAAYNAATIDTVDMGAGTVLITFRYTSFGSLTAGVGEIVGYVKRTACTNNMTRKGLIRRVELYGVGLR